MDREEGITPTTEYYSVCTFTYSGTLAAGKLIEIDGEDFTVVNNDTNGIGDFTGDFPVLFPGANCVTYTDSEAARTAIIDISRKERRI
jgi:hypothetical protein